MLPYRILLGVGVFFLGLALGSFSNVVIYRLPRGLSLVKPGSFCPSCSRPIAFYDNVPLVSFILLRGRCRACGEKISLQYPLVELVSGLAWLGVFAFTGFGWDAFLLLYLYFVTVTLIVGVIDLQQGVIPNRIVLPSLVVGVIAVAIISLVRGDLHVLSEHLLGMVIGGLPLGLIALLVPRGMGMGDAKLMAFAGLVLGFRILPALFSGFLLGSLVALVLVAAGKRGWRERVPFGPFLVLGSWIALFYGTRIIDLYKTIAGWR
jgi:leader peptidase (prepilin peptidase)/N-methyltransferase